jgi:cation transport ATPase
MPSVAHRKQDWLIADAALGAAAVGDTLVVFPTEICLLDSTVVEGHGQMDESYLTGEPYQM